jgi:hypothetical protein
MMEAMEMAGVENPGTIVYIERSIELRAIVVSTGLIWAILQSA